LAHPAIIGEESVEAYYYIPAIIFGSKPDFCIFIFLTGLNS
jgi:hypothetical protein